MARGSFSLQDQLALMMTSAGSQRQLAALITASGAKVSHQQVGRWLTIGQTTPQGEPSRVREPQDASVRKAIAKAWDTHIKLARDQAASDHIPFLSDVPAYAYRGTYKDGSPGQRVIVDKTHRLSNELRARLVMAAHGERPGFFWGVTVASKVARVPYWLLREDRIDFTRSRLQELYRARLEPDTDEIADYERGVIDVTTINTPITSMTPHAPASAVVHELENNLQRRHSIAVGDPGTALATSIVFQTNSQRDRYGAGFAAERAREHERERKAKQRARKRDKQRAFEQEIYEATKPRKPAAKKRVRKPAKRK